MTVLRFRKPRTTYGSDDFTTMLAEREAALGLAVADVAETTPDAPIAPAMTAPATAPATASAPADYGRDRFGNRITSARGWYGQYTVECQRTGRTVYVCGAPEQHIRQGCWRLDSRWWDGQGYICSTCFTVECGRYGIADERR